MKNLLLYLFFLLNSCVHIIASNLYVCTVATAENECFNLLKRGCEFNNIQLHVLGWKKKYPGNYIKIVWAQEFLSTLKDDDVFMLVDGYDVLILACEQEIKSKFFAMKKDFIIGAEGVLYPASKRFKKNYPKGKSRFRYINAGCYIGYVWAVKKILSELSTEHKLSQREQWRFHEHFIKNNDLYMLDYDAELFLNLSRTPTRYLDFDLKRKRVCYKPTDSLPIAVHGSGIKKSIIKELGNLFFG